jgi:tetratricopeptide (TPR) repeat protein
MKAHYVGTLLGFSFADSPYLHGVESDPKQLRVRAQFYLTQYFGAVARRTPTVLMLDDIHWADALSLSFVMDLVRNRSQLPLLVVCMARPTLSERFPEWGQEVLSPEQPLADRAPQPRSAHLGVGPLSRAASLELLAEMLRKVEGLPQGLCEKIADSAEGNPFYLEEFIQTLVDAKAIQRDRRRSRWRLDPERLGELELPTTLVALLEARLDSLSASQRVLVQQASVIGRVFWRSALQAVRGERPVTEADMASLSRRGFIQSQEPSTFAGTEEYVFQHALLRDVAYQSLVKGQRQAHHKQVAAWLVGTTYSCGRSDEFAPVIAEHYVSAGERALAADWYVQAGVRARNQGAPSQARVFFDRALALFPSGSAPPTAPADLQRYWQALAGRDEVLGILGETEARVADDNAMVALAESMGDDHLLAEACYRRGRYLGVMGQYRQELEAYTRGLAAAARAQDYRREALILGLQVICEMRLGDLEAAAQTAEAALRTAEQLADDEVLARNLINVSALYTETGDMARAAQLLDQQLSIHRLSGNRQGEAVGLANLGYAYVLLGLPEQGVQALRRSLDLAQSIGHREFGAYAGLNLALAHLRRGDAPAAIAELEIRLPDLRAMNDRFGCAIGQTYLALAREQIGQISEALAGFDQAASSLGELGTPGQLHDAQAGAARCLLALGDLEAAQRRAASLWDYLQQNAGASMELAMLGYETCADVFQAAGRDRLAQLVLEAGHRELMARASKISLPEWRQSFLEQVPEHRRIQARWQKIAGTFQQ